MRKKVPIVAHLERSDHGIAPELSNNNADHSLGRLLASDEVEKQLAMNASCSTVDAMVPSQGTNAIRSRALLADHSLAGWTAPWEV